MEALKGIATSAMLFLMFLVAGCLQPALAGEFSTPESLVLTVYLDGYVHVEYVVSVDPEVSKVDVELFGKTFEGLTVVDEE
ncbi:TPA: hypothetical protein EYP27_00980, partial [Candidatus Bathyarchaeota archaeon]|nr:hypothetical protein [Candidatus Bathyarchaeota archaeon]